jgi:WD40 repeat protein
VTGPGTGAGRRFLLTAVVSHYQNDPSLNREQLAADLQDIIQLFTSELGYQHVPGLGLDPTGQEIRDALRRFSKEADREPDDYVVVYLAGHGEILPAGEGYEHVILPADADPDDLRVRAVRTPELAQLLLGETGVRRLLVVIDSCYSGAGGRDFAREALAQMSPHARRTGDPGGALVVIAATMPKQQALAGEFAKAFSRAIHNPATAGHAPGSLDLGAVVEMINHDPLKPSFQQVEYHVLGASEKIPDFFPNPRRDAALVDLDLALADRQWQARLGNDQQRAAEAADHFIPRIGGFAGRNRALTDITRWLETPADHRSLIVNGDPGSGKTAILGVLDALSDPRRRPTVPRDGLPVSGIPGPDTISVSIYAGNRTAAEVLTRIAAAAGVEGIDAVPARVGTGIGELLTALRQSGNPITAMIDGLDEASDPADLASQLLRPLMDRGDGLIRLLLGTRRSVCAELGRGWQDLCQVIDLDIPGYADPGTLAVTVRRILIETAGSPFAGCPAVVLDEVTRIIADTAGHSFFVARILADTQAALATVPNPADPAFPASLPAAAGPAMRRDLELRLGDQADRAVDLLMPLAYAQGSGLPWEDIWADLSNALSPGHGYTNEDLLWLARQAGSFIAEAGAIADRSVYRLYHRSLAEYLLASRGELADQHAITAALTKHVPLRRNGRRDWGSAHPYIRTYLASHAARSGDINHLAQDPGFLVTATPGQLLAALDTVTNPAARAAAAAYRHALPKMRRHPEDRSAYLELAARWGQADALADRIDADGLTGAWRTRWASRQPTAHLQNTTGYSDAERHHRDPYMVLEGHNWTWSLCAVSARGRNLIASGGSGRGARGADNTIRIWDLATGELASLLKGHQGPVKAICSLPDSQGDLLVSSGYDDGTIRIWDPLAGEQVMLIEGNQRAIHALCVVVIDGRHYLASGGGDGTVRIWDPKAGNQIVQMSGHRMSVRAVCAAGSDRLASGSADGSVRIWDLATGEQLYAVEGSRLWVTAVCPVTMPGGSRGIASAGPTGIIRIWNPDSGAEITHLGNESADIDVLSPVTAAGQADYLAGAARGQIGIWDLGTGRRTALISTGQQTVTALCLVDVHGRPMIASGGHDGVIRIWDRLASAKPAGAQHDNQRQQSPASRTLEGPAADYRETIRIPEPPAQADFTALCPLPVGPRVLLACAPYEGPIQLRDPVTGSQLAALGETNLPVTAICPLTLEGRRLLASAGLDRQIRIWDPTAPAEISHIDASSDLITALHVMTVAENSLLVSAHRSSVHVWDPHTNTRIAEMSATEIGETCVANLKGRNLLISANRKTIQVWDPDTWRPSDLMPVASATALTAVTVQSRPLLLIGDFSGRILAWDLAASSPAAAFLAHHGPVTALCPVTAKQQTFVASAGNDGAVRIWDINSGTCVKSMTMPSMIAPYQNRNLAWLGDALAIGLTGGVILIDPKIGS